VQGKKETSGQGSVVSGQSRSNRVWHWPLSFEPKPPCVETVELDIISDSMVRSLWD